MKEKFYKDTVEIRKLKASPRFRHICSIIERKEPEGFSGVELRLSMAIHRALALPHQHALLTKVERQRMADRILASANELANLLDWVSADSGRGRDWPLAFQSQLDYFALESACRYQEMLEQANSPLAEILNNEETEGFHIARYAIYQMLYGSLPELLDTIIGAAEWWRESGEQALAKPNHKNAPRLYFIRSLTKSCMEIFGRPARELVLEIASVYFDCGDLSVADLSNLAPVRSKPKKSG